MEFITVRDLRTRPSQIWDKLDEKQDLILTSNGRPIAVLSHVEEGRVEETLAVLRRARAQAALSRLRADAAAQGLDRLSTDQIEAEIAAARTERRESANEESPHGDSLQ
jgi:antitoxin (DNA-binding transcriptional repressor) of toxin-antitoxin stability system